MTGTTGRMRTGKTEMSTTTTQTTRPHRRELLLAGWTTVATDYDHGDARKRKPNNDEGMTRDDQGGRAGTSGATDPTTAAMGRRQREYLTTTDTAGKHNNEEDGEDGEDEDEDHHRHRHSTPNHHRGRLLAGWKRGATGRGDGYQTARANNSRFSRELFLFSIIHCFCSPFPRCVRGRLVMLISITFVSSLALSK
jgi:hypothetical protein